MIYTVLCKGNISFEFTWMEEEIEPKRFGDPADGRPLRCAKHMLQGGAPGGLGRTRGFGPPAAPGNFLCVNRIALSPFGRVAGSAGQGGFCRSGDDRRVQDHASLPCQSERPCRGCEGPAGQGSQRQCGHDRQ
jgi:hypothetical protein